MFRKIILSAFIFSTVCSTILFAQTDNETIPNEIEYSKLPSLGIGAGSLSYFGDLNTNSNVGLFSQVRGGINFSIEQRFNKYIGLNLSGLYGKVSYNERILRNLNFESPIINASLNAIIYFDNDLIMSHETNFAPFVSLGIGYLKFDPMGDLEDAYGNTYYYWKNGSIKDLPETEANKDVASTIKRDYEYETILTSSKNYDRNAISFPLTFGFKLKLSKSFSSNIYGTYYISNSDYIDNVSENNKSDNLLFTGLSISYQLGVKKEKKDESAYSNIDYKSIENIDTDDDGVADFQDICQNTPKGTKVDSKGCPIDGDEDGVPDYMDKEPKSKKGAIVDSYGVTLTDAMIAEKMANDSLAVERNEMFNQNPSLLTLRQMEDRGIKNRPDKIESPYILSPEFKLSDSNKDGYLSVDEIMNAIDTFFEGYSELNVERINKLIDYFFEQ